MAKSASLVKKIETNAHAYTRLLCFLISVKIDRQKKNDVDRLVNNSILDYEDIQNLEHRTYNDELFSIS